MEIDAVLFDMDGLILDTEPVYRRACREALGDQGLTITDEQYTHLCGLGPAEVHKRLVGMLPESFDDELYRPRYRVHRDRCFGETSIAVKPGVVSVLDRLEARSVRRSVATSTRRDVARRRLTDAGLIGRFADVVGGDQVDRGKPAPDLFLLAASRLGVAPGRCLVLEDSQAGVQAAAAAGMRVAMVPDLKQPDPETRARVVGVYPTLSDVLELLQILGV